MKGKRSAATRFFRMLVACLIAAAVLGGFVHGGLSHEERSLRRVVQSLPRADDPGPVQMEDFGLETPFEPAVPQSVPSSLTFTGARVSQRGESEIQDLEFSYKAADGGLAVFQQTNAPFKLAGLGRDGYRTVDVSGITLEVQPGAAFGRPELIEVTWVQGDVYVLAVGILSPSLGEQDFMEMVRSAVSSSDGSAQTPTPPEDMR